MFTQQVKKSDKLQTYKDDWFEPPLTVLKGSNAKHYCE